MKKSNKNRYSLDERITILILAPDGEIFREMPGNSPRDYSLAAQLVRRLNGESPKKSC